MVKIIRNNKKIILSILAVFLIVGLVTGCGSDGTEEVTDTVYENINKEDFAYKYPSKWEKTTDDQEFNSLKNDFGSYYSEGSLVEGNNKNQFFILAMDYSGANVTINEEAIKDIINSMKSSEMSGLSSYEFIEQSSLKIDGNPAEKITFEYYDQTWETRTKASMIATYKGNNLFIIGYGSKATEYNNNIGLYTEMKDSIKTYK